MKNNQGKDLFQLQSELVDMKVNMAVSNAIDRVVEQITSLRHEMQAEMNSFRHEMHTLKHYVHDEIYNLRLDMNHGFSSLDKRVVAIETKLGMVNETRKEVRSKIIDYSFKAGWLILGMILTAIIVHFR